MGLLCNKCIFSNYIGTRIFRVFPINMEFVGILGILERE